MNIFLPLSSCGFPLAPSPDRTDSLLRPSVRLPLDRTVVSRKPIVSSSATRLPPRRPLFYRYYHPFGPSWRLCRRSTPHPPLGHGELLRQRNCECPRFAATAAPPAVNHNTPILETTKKKNYRCTCLCVNAHRVRHRQQVSGLHDKHDTICGVSQGQRRRGRPFIYSFSFHFLSETSRRR